MFCFHPRPVSFDAGKMPQVRHVCTYDASAFLSLSFSLCISSLDSLALISASCRLTSHTDTFTGSLRFHCKIPDFAINRYTYSECCASTSLSISHFTRHCSLYGFRISIITSVRVFVYRCGGVDNYFSGGALFIVTLLLLIPCDRISAKLNNIHRDSVHCRKN